MITIKYFGAIAAETKTTEEAVSFAEQSLEELLQTVTAKHGFDSIAFSVAVNQELVQDLANYRLQSDDVVALLPPFAGG
ncbi:MoaD/ThiS family protein [Flavobacterium sp. 14A]|uniref:MoaD/ThiS family protein n=1 Tax=Flavobacterium sp. 14A TaxID=2735896 RepID=UPI00156E8F22|nr:MoaD/ThiS family protein [Flavobacterium sp. 14A]NRT12530.1 molybdopterin synthase sulfur carrier subunit [Flavobacterium sp. 14A]